ncbi:MAG: tetratricopeptide repeat protein [Ignavibacteria bacterium]|nr:tetratricopeptide repeat protein [Ignavibacteria bacterium]
MLTPKKKIKVSSKELKKDELLTFVERASAWYYAYQKNVTTAVIAVLTIVGALWYYSYHVRSNNERASAELGKVYSLYDNGQFKEAIEGNPDNKIPGLKSLVENYDGTDAGEIAELYLANAYSMTNDYENALKHFERCNVSDARLKAAVLAGIASCKELQKNYREAAEHYRKAAALSGVSVATPEYIFYAANNFALCGEKETARELYKRLKKEFPQSQQARDIDRFLEAISG